MMKALWIPALLLMMLVYSCKKDVSNLTDTSQLYVPTVFTPNGDGQNDSFTVKGNSLVYYNIKIYDPSNTLVFESNDINNSWDGRYDGKPAPAATYFWVIEYQTTNSKRLTRSGYIGLVR